MSRPLAAVLTACSLACLSASAEPAAPAPSPHAAIVAGLKARPLGPANTGGRVTDLAVVESDPDTFYVAAAGGGVWKTTDGGDTFTPVFDDQPTLSTGAARKVSAARSALRCSLS